MPPLQPLGVRTGVPLGPATSQTEEMLVAAVQRPRVGSEMHQAIAHSDRDGLSPGLGAKLLQDVVDMVVDR